jgi:predicted nucleotidyltransferase
VDAGLVTRDASHRPHAYRAAASSPAYEPLRGLLDLTAGVPARFADALSAIPGVLAAAIHGSWATGKVRPDSDVDVIVVTAGERRIAQRAVREVGRTIGRNVDASVLSPEDFDGMLRSRNPFLGKILNGPRIDLLGDLDELCGEP